MSDSEQFYSMGCNQPGGTTLRVQIPPMTPERSRSNSNLSLEGHSMESNHYNHVRADLTPSHITEKGTRLSSLKARALESEANDDEADPTSFQRKRAAADELGNEPRKKTQLALGPEDYVYIGHHSLEPRLKLSARLSAACKGMSARIHAFQELNMPQDIKDKWNSLLPRNGYISAQHVLLDPEIFEAHCTRVEASNMLSLSIERKKELIKNYLQQLKTRGQVTATPDDDIIAHPTKNNGAMLHVGTLKSDHKIPAYVYLSSTNCLLFCRDLASVDRLGYRSVRAELINVSEEYDKGSWILTREAIKLKLIEMTSDDTGKIDEGSQRHAEVPPIILGQEIVTSENGEHEMSDSDEEQEAAAEAKSHLYESVDMFVKAHLAPERRLRIELQQSETQHTSLTEQITAHEAVIRAGESRISYLLQTVETLEQASQNKDDVITQLRRKVESLEGEKVSMTKKGKENADGTLPSTSQEREDQVAQPQNETARLTRVIQELHEILNERNNQANLSQNREVPSDTHPFPVPTIATISPNLSYEGDNYRIIPPGRENAGMYRERSSRKFPDDSSGKVYEERRYLQDLTFEVKGTTLEGIKIDGVKYARFQENGKEILVSALAPQFSFMHEGRTFVKRVLRREVEDED